MSSRGACSRKQVFVARSRRNNGVERNRRTMPWGILLEAEPLEKHFREGIGGGGTTRGGEKGDAGQGLGAVPRPVRWWGMVCPRIMSTDVDGLRILGEWHEVSRKSFSYRQ